MSWELLLETAGQNINFIVVGLLASLITIEITPIKIYPLRWLGNRLNGDLKQQLEEVRKATQVNRDIGDERRMKDLRRRLLTFADNLAKGMNASEQTYDDNLEAYDEYEDLIKQHDFKNGKIDLAIKFIRDEYLKHKRDDTFLK